MTTAEIIRAIEEATMDTVNVYRGHRYYIARLVDANVLPGATGTTRDAAVRNLAKRLGIEVTP